MAVNESTLDIALQATSLSIIMLLGFVFNILVVIVFLNSKALRASNHNIFVINLIVCDIIYLSTVMPISLADIVCHIKKCTSIVRSGLLCQVTGFLTTFQSTVTAQTLGVIAIDRYIVIVLEKNLFIASNKKPWFVVLLALWVWAALCASPPLVFPDYVGYKYNIGTKHCSPELKYTCWYYWFMAFNVVYAPVPVMTFCYTKIVMKIRDHRKDLSNQNRKQSTSEASPEKRFSHRQSMLVESRLRLYLIKSKLTLERELAKRGFIMVVVYILCWGLYAIVFSCPAYMEIPTRLEVVAMWSVFTLVVWNPILYVFNDRLFKEELKRCFIKRNQC